MKKLTYNLQLSITIVLLLFSTSTFAKKGSFEKSKKVNKTFTVSAEQIIELDNKFGKLNITSWDKNEVEVNISITVNGENEKKTQETLDKIKIDISNNSTFLSIKTLIGDNQKKIKLNSGKNGNLSIDYIIKIPRNNRLKAENSFGPFFLDKLRGDALIKVNFGSATIGSIMGQSNQLEFQFSDPVIITEMNEGKISLKHSKLELLKSKKLTLASEMSSSKIGKVEKGDINLQFGSSDINEVKDLYLTSQMSSVKINKVYNKGTVKTSYGSFTISNVMKGASQLTIKGEFSPIKVNLDKNNSYHVEANSKMGELKMPKGSVNEKQNNEEKLFNNEKAFKGHVGANSGTAIPIKIQSSFGEVKLSLAD